VLQVATDDVASGISFGCLSSSDAYPLTVQQERPCQ